jgi:ubiquinone/menaquinone biosynthesis C-methylase UbiE
MNCDALGVDADPDMIARAADLSRAQPRVQFRAGDALALPFSPPEAFDLVTATNLIFLLPDPLAGLKEMARVGKPGSVVAMLNPSPKLSRATAQAHADSLRLADFDAFSLTNWGAIAETHRRFTETDLRLMFAEVGLQSVEIVEKIGPGLALFAKGIK